VVWVPLGAAVSAALLYVYSRRFDDLPETRYLRLLALLVMAWTLLVALDLATTGLDEKTLILKFKFLTTSFVSVVVFGVLASHSGKEAWLTRWNLALLCVIPAITVALAFVLELQPYLVHDISIAVYGPLYILETPTGPWMDVYLVYAYALLTAGVALLIGSVRGANPLYKRQAAVILVALAIPSAVDVLSNIDTSYIVRNFFSPWAFTVGIAVMTWGLHRYRILDVRPIARSEVVENMTDIVLVFDPSERLIDHNPAARSVLGPEVELLGTPLSEVFPFDRELTSKFKEGGTFRTEVSVGQGAERRTYEASVMPVTVGSEVRARMMIMRDITERKRIEEALRVANARLGLLSSITRHDLANKLTAIEGYVGLALREKEPDKARTYLSKCQMASGAARSLIQFTREYEGLESLAPDWCAVDELFRRAAGQLNLEGVGLDVSVGGLRVYGDAMLEKVFLNLMDNSLRHGGNVSRISLACQDRGDCLVLAYQDNGAGVPAEEKARIFDRGYGKNTGLGLSLVKGILAITGIEITETGEPGKGARFEMTVPGGAYRFENEASAERPAPEPS
jgi:PAS domain S-box-containing protein